MLIAPLAPLVSFHCGGILIQSHDSGCGWLHRVLVTARSHPQMCVAINILSLINNI